MDYLLARLFSRPPVSLTAAFQKHWLLTVVSRMRWMFVVSVFFHLILFGADWLRYQAGTLWSNPIHQRLFLTHLASLGLTALYGILALQQATVRQQRLQTANWLLISIYVIYSLYGIPRAALAYQDRHTLVFLMLYLVVVQVIFLIGHVGRFITSAAVLIWMLYAVRGSQNGSLTDNYMALLEVTLLTVSLACLSTYLYNVFVREFTQHQIIKEQTQRLEQQTALLDAERSRAIQELSQRSQELISYVLQEQQRNAFLVELKERLEQSDPSDSRLLRLIDGQLSQEDRWKHFILLFEHLHPQFFSRIQAAYPTLSAHDLRLMALLKLNLSTKEIANLLGISPQSANTARYRLRKRLNLEAEASLEAFLQAN